MTRVMFALLLLLLQYLREHDRTRHTLKRDKQNEERSIKKSKSFSKHARGRNGVNLWIRY